MWMIILIVLVISLMVGPIMMMRPSPKDAKTARMRVLALSKGLKVTMQKRPEGAERDLLPVYFLPWPHATLKRYPEAIDWTVYKENFKHDIHFHGDWNLLSVQSSTSSTKISDNLSTRGKPPVLWHEPIKKFLDENMQGSIGLTSSRAGLGVFWDEKLRGKTEEEAVSCVSKKLMSLAADLI